MQGKIKTMALCGVSDVFKGISNLSKGYHSAQTNKISGKANARKYWKIIASMKYCWR